MNSLKRKLKKNNINLKFYIKANVTLHAEKRTLTYSRSNAIKTSFKRCLNSIRTLLKRCVGSNWNDVLIPLAGRVKTNLTFRGKRIQTRETVCEGYILNTI